jgi:predicted nuclease with TOPRIM domain
MEDVKGELLERYKVLPGLSSRLSETESQYEEMRENNRQLELKLTTMQVNEKVKIHCVQNM